jgi:AcrR family transcriptional regulator
LASLSSAPPPADAPERVDGADAHPGFARRPRYHHGDLREALITATHQLVVERGGEHFTLADACRVAGVSTAAPYKHFRDKQELLEIVCQRGFDRMTEKIVGAVQLNGSGTRAAIEAMGRAYVTFARTEPALFRHMFSPQGEPSAGDDLPGKVCFATVIAEIERYSATVGIATDARALAVQLWTFVHGLSCLLIDGAYEKVAPDVDIDHLLSVATAGLLDGAAQAATRRA